MPVFLRFLAGSDQARRGSNFSLTNFSSLLFTTKKDHSFSIVERGDTLAGRQWTREGL